MWALLVLSRAARASLAEQRPGACRGAVPGATRPVPRRGRQADLWLAAAIGLFALAIGYGFTSAACSSPGTGVAAGVLQALGAGARWPGSLAVARSRQDADPARFPVVLTGLALLAISFLAYAVVACGLRHAVRAGGRGPVVTAVELAGVAVLGLAAWTRVRELYR